MLCTRGFVQFTSHWDNHRFSKTLTTCTTELEIYEIKKIKKNWAMEISRPQDLESWRHWGIDVIGEDRLNLSKYIFWSFFLETWIVQVISFCLFFSHCLSNWMSCFQTWANIPYQSMSSYLWMRRFCSTGRFVAKNWSYLRLSPPNRCDWQYCIPLEQEQRKDYILGSSSPGGCQ